MLSTYDSILEHQETRFDSFFFLRVELRRGSNRAAMYAWEAVSPNRAAAFAPRDGAGGWKPELTNLASPPWPPAGPRPR